MSETKKRKVHTPEYKAKVALEALRSGKTINQIGQEFDVHPVQVGQWKKAIQEQARMGPAPATREEDYDLINAGKQPVTLRKGGSFFHHADSFAMMRGGRLDICVLGAFQVSATGNLANWHTGEKDAIPAVGGAMDLAVGAKQTWVMMDLLTKQGESKLVQACTYPLIGIGCVKRFYSDLATLECTPQGLRLIDKVEGLAHAELETLVGLPISS